VGTLLLCHAGKGTIAAAGGGCAEATSFLARTTGLDAAHQSAYTTFICGLVTDGVFAKLDILYVLNTQDAATSLLNLTSSSFPLTNVGTLAFTADHGYATMTSTAYLTTTWAENAGGNHYIVTSSSMGVWSKTSAQAGGTAWGDNGGNSRLICRFTDDNTYYNANDLNFDATTAANTDGSGLIAGTRTGTTTQIYRNGATLGAAGTVSFSQAVSATTWQLGNNASDSVAPAMAFAGQFLTSADMLALFNRYSTWNTTISGGNP
jgi:hypothetical protein